WRRGCRPWPCNASTWSRRPRKASQPANGTELAKQRKRSPLRPSFKKEHAMADVKKDIKANIDTAASKAKQATDKAVDAGKDMASKAGDKVKETGQKIKDAGK